MSATIYLLTLAAAPGPARGQTLPSEARGSATSQIVMLSVHDQGCAAGIVAGYDDKNIYVATAAHIRTDPSAAPSSKVTARFLDVDGPRIGTFLLKLSEQADGDLAVVVVPRDSALDTYLDGLNFAMLASSKTPPVGRSVTSIGCWGGTKWASGDDESLLSAGAVLRVRSTVNEGQSGGGVFSDSWELIGMPLATGVNEISARPIAAILDDLRAWDLPVLLRARSPRDRVMGAEELAQRVLRRDLSQRLASQSADTRSDAPVRALLLGVEAVKRSRANGYPTAAAREALAESLAGLSGVGIGGHADGIERSAFSADERFLATASEDGLIRIWSLATSGTPKTVKVLQDPAGVEPDFMTFDRRARRFISFVYDFERRAGRMTFWALDTPDATPLAQETPLARNGRVAAAAVSGDYGLLATAQGGRVLTYSLADGGLLLPLRALSVPDGVAITHFAFSRDGKVLVGAGADARVLIWNLSSSGDAPASVVVTQHKQLGPFGDVPQLDLIQISDDRSILLTGSTKWSLESSFADPVVKLWSLKDLKPTGEVTVLDTAPEPGNKALKYAFLTEGARTLVAGTLMGRINAWSLGNSSIGGPKSLDSSFELKGHAGGAARSPDGRLFAFGHDAFIELMRTDELKGEAPHRVTLGGFDSALTWVEFSPSGRFLFGASGGGSGRLWDLQRVNPLSPVGTLVATPYAEVVPLTLSATGRTVAVMRKDKLEVWSISEPERPHLLLATDFEAEEKQEGSCTACNAVLSPDDRWLVVRANKGAKTLDVLEVGAQAHTRRRFTIAPGRARAWDEVRFSPDGRWLFVDEANNVWVAYDLSVAKPRRVVLTEGRAFYPLEFSPDGRWLFRKSMQMMRERYVEDGFLIPLATVADRATWTPLKGFVRGIGSFEFSPDSRWAAVAGEYEYPTRELDDRRVQVLRLEGGAWRKHAEFTPIEYAASGLRFSPDGRWLFTGSTDTTLRDRNVSARVWDLAAPLTPSSGQTLPTAIWNIKQVGFSPNSKWLITVSGAQSYATLWRLKDGQVEFVSKLFGPLPKRSNDWYCEFSPDSKIVVIWTREDTTPFLWKLDDEVISEVGVAIPNGDREIADAIFSTESRRLIILNADPWYTDSAEGHFTVVDLENFPAEDAYAALPAAGGASSFRYREDLSLILSWNEERLVVSQSDLDRELARAGIVAGRNLSWEEWQKSPLRETYQPTFPEHLVMSDVVQAVLPSIISLAQSGRKAEAAQVQENVIKWARELRDGKVCNSVAWELATLGSMDTAMEFAQCALRAAPLDPDYRDTHGYVLARLGRREDALREFTYFLENVEGVDRFQNAMGVRRRWVERLRNGQDPFAEPAN